MGIRCYCPNGHRLHVKSFLAGKRGVCPKCNARFDIPTETADEDSAASPSARPVNDLAAETVEVERLGGSNEDRGGVTRADRPNGTSKPRAAVETRVENVARDSAVAESGRDVEHAASDQPSTWLSAADRASDTGAGDPIAIAPDALWYVRPSSGGQFGPANADVMRRWVSEGRVAADSLVWRSGWADWKIAEVVFPGLATSRSLQTGSDVDPKAAAAPTSSIDEMVAVPRFVDHRKPRRKSSSRKLITVVALSLLSIVLLVALIIVIASNSNLQ